MTPEKLSARLRRIAATIDSSRYPSKNLVIEDLNSVYESLSGEPSNRMAFSISELFKKILKKKGPAPEPKPEKPPINYEAIHQNLTKILNRLSDLIDYKVKKIQESIANGKAVECAIYATELTGSWARLASDVNEALKPLAELSPEFRDPFPKAFEEYAKKLGISHPEGLDDDSVHFQRFLAEEGDVGLDDIADMTWKVATVLTKARIDLEKLVDDIDDRF